MKLFQISLIIIFVACMYFGLKNKHSDTQREKQVRFRLQTIEKIPLDRFNSDKRDHPIRVELDSSTEYPNLSFILNYKEDIEMSDSILKESKKLISQTPCYILDYDIDMVLKNHKRRKAILSVIQKDQVSVTVTAKHGKKELGTKSELLTDCKTYKRLTHQLHNKNSQ